MQRRCCYLVITLLVYTCVGAAAANAAQGGAPDSERANLPRPVVVAGGSESYQTLAGRFVRYRLLVTNWAAYPAELFTPAPDLPPCGKNAKSARTWVNIYDAPTNNWIYGFCAFTSPQDMASVWFAQPEGTPPPRAVYVAIEDRREKKVYRSDSLDPSSLSEGGASELLYEQSVDACQKGTFSNTASGPHQVMATQFAIPETAAVTGIRWYGYYNASVHPDTVPRTFQISFIADRNGLPGGGPLYSGTVSARAYDTGIRVQQSPYPESIVYVFTAFSLPRISIPAGQRTWVSIAEADPSTPAAGPTQWL